METIKANNTPRVVQLSLELFLHSKYKVVFMIPMFRPSQSYVIKMRNTLLKL